MPQPAITDSAVVIATRIAAITEEVNILRRDQASIDDKCRKLLVEREGLSRQYEAAGVRERVLTHEQAAAKSRAEQEEATTKTKQHEAEAAAVAASLKEKESKLDELIAKASAAAEPPKA